MLDAGGWSAPRPSCFTPAKETRYLLCCRVDGPQSCSGRVAKTSPPLGFCPRAWQPVAGHSADHILQAHKFGKCITSKCQKITFLCNTLIPGRLHIFALFVNGITLLLLMTVWWCWWWSWLSWWCDGGGGGDGYVIQNVMIVERQDKEYSSFTVKIFIMNRRKSKTVTKNSTRILQISRSGVKFHRLHLNYVVSLC